MPPRLAGAVFRACQMGGQAAHDEDRQEPAPAPHQHGRWARRAVGPFPCVQGGGAGVCVYAGFGGKGEGVAHRNKKGAAASQRPFFMSQPAHSQF